MNRCPHCLRADHHPDCPSRLGPNRRALLEERLAEQAAKEARLERFAAAALTGLIASAPAQFDTADAVHMAFDLAEMMEEERVLRVPNWRTED